MIEISKHLLKTVYILSNNNFLLPGVENLLAELSEPDTKFSVKQITNSELHIFLAKMQKQKGRPDTVNYFIAEKFIFYILKSNKLSDLGILIPPTVALCELQRILTECHKKMATLNADTYYRITHSNREVEVVSLLLEGLPQKSIADKLGISVKTVSHHKQIAIKKSGFANFNELYMRNLSVHPLLQTP